MSPFFLKFNQLIAEIKTTLRFKISPAPGKNRRPLFTTIIKPYCYKLVALL